MPYGRPVPPPSGSPAQKRRAAAARKLATRRAAGTQDTLTPGHVLGGSAPAGAPGLRGLARMARNSSQLNKGTPEAAAVGWGSERVGHRFTVGFTPDGRVVHMYGTNVPKDQRRVVLSRGQSKAARRRMNG